MLVVVVRKRAKRHADVVITWRAVFEDNLEGVVSEQTSIVRASAVQRAVGSCEVAAVATAVRNGIESICEETVLVWRQTDTLIVQCEGRAVGIQTVFVVRVDDRFVGRLLSCLVEPAEAKLFEAEDFGTLRVLSDLQVGVSGIVVLFVIPIEVNDTL